MSVTSSEPLYTHTNTHTRSVDASEFFFDLRRFSDLEHDVLPDGKDVCLALKEEKQPPRRPAQIINYTANIKSDSDLGTKSTATFLRSEIISVSRSKDVFQPCFILESRAARLSSQTARSEPAVVWGRLGDRALWGLRQLKAAGQPRRSEKPVVLT